MRNVATRSEYQGILNKYLSEPGATAALARHLGFKGTQAISRWKRGDGPGPQYRGLLADYFKDEKLRTRTPDPPASLTGEQRRELRDALLRVLDVLEQMEG